MLNFAECGDIILCVKTVFLFVICHFCSDGNDERERERETPIGVGFLQLHSGTK